MIQAMPTKPKRSKPKPGPEPESLVITEDPEQALRRLLKSDTRPPKGTEAQPAPKPPTDCE